MMQSRLRLPINDGKYVLVYVYKLHMYVFIDVAFLARKSLVTLLEFLILIAFITGNSSLEPLIEGLCAQIHVNLR